MSPKKPIQTDDLPWKRAVKGILKTGYLISDRLNDTLKPFGISEQQLNVLFILKKGPANLGDVQEQMFHKMSNATRLVEKLRLKGFVTRKIDEDNRRRVDIAITKKGLSFLEKIETQLEEGHHCYYENKLSEEEFLLLADLLDKFRK
ncbi:MAG: MarR family transcriptional regulator [Chitinophagaceae bacterium]|nr:MarR family transcriptional regulator [Chitinophagaceae bacterium]